MGQKTILLIEDNALNMKLFNSILQIGRYRILNATTGESGIQIAREHRPDLILMDIQLPDLDGLTATRIIKEDPALIGHCSAILLTHDSAGINPDLCRGAPPVSISVRRKQLR